MHTTQVAERDSAPAQAAVDPLDEEFTLDVTVLEISDPDGLITMTDDGCGSSCEGTTCISSS